MHPDVWPIENDGRADGNQKKASLITTNYNCRSLQERDFSKRAPASSAASNEFEYALGGARFLLHSSFRRASTIEERTQSTLTSCELLGDLSQLMSVGYFDFRDPPPSAKENVRSKTLPKWKSPTVFWKSQDPTPRSKKCPLGHLVWMIPWWSSRQWKYPYKTSWRIKAPLRDEWQLRQASPHQSRSVPYIRNFHVNTVCTNEHPRRYESFKM